MHIRDKGIGQSHTHRYTQAGVAQGISTSQQTLVENSHCFHGTRWFFLRVIFKRRSAFHMATSEQPNSSAISLR